MTACLSSLHVLTC